MIDISYITSWLEPLQKMIGEINERFSRWAIFHDEQMPASVTRTIQIAYDSTRQYRAPSQCC